MFSVVSLWEIVIKQQIGKLKLRADLATVVSQQLANGMQMLPITYAHVMAIENLPTPHKDPFDRMLVAQANVENAVLLSADAIFSQYPVTVLW